MVSLLYFIERVSVILGSELEVGPPALNLDVVPDILDPTECF